MRCPPEVDVLRDLQGLQNRGRYDQQGLQNRGRYGQQELQSRGRYDQDIVVVSEDEMAAPERETMSRRRETRSGFEASLQRSTSLPMTTRSGCDVSGSGPMGASSLERRPPSGSGPSMSQRSRSQSTTAGTLSSGVGSSSKRMTRQSGSRSGGKSSSSVSITTPSGSQVAGEITTS